MSTDGVDHVNVYSRASTELGRLLSNFAHTPFKLGDNWFESVEGWWYWRKTGDERLRHLHGLEAKHLGQSLPQRFGGPIADPTREELLAVYQAKCDQNPRVRELLLKNRLPFDHYYVYGGMRKDTHHRWTGQLWSEVRP